MFTVTAVPLRGVKLRLAVSVSVAPALLKATFATTAWSASVSCPVPPPTALVTSPSESESWLPASAATTGTGVPGVPALMPPGFVAVVMSVPLRSSVVVPGMSVSPAGSRSDRKTFRVTPCGKPKEML